MKNLRQLIVMTALVLFCLPAFTQTNISGVVNTYYSVLEVVPAKACVRLNSVAGLAYGDKVMLVQMKGATINTSNSASFGDTTGLNHAGNYEIGTVCYIRGDSVFMIYMLLNQYTSSAKMQLVRIPQYVSANVIGELRAAQWNNTTGTGGVLAIFVEQDLILNAPITADTMGYRGGAPLLSSGTCGNGFPIAAASAFYYNANVTPGNTQDGAFKGEGAAEVAAAQSGGKGAPANGGGGGNNHNNGGAGGANLTAGGDGGGNSSSAGCRVSNFGLKGKPLSTHGGTKIFMGGGGGAGHGNNTTPSTQGGGNGGGIVFIRADNLTGNGYKISANGETGGQALGDGAAGGGAGGTIIMSVNNYIGATTIEANGGTGGMENDGGNVQRCYGAGGGGSGGVVYFSGATPAVTVNINGGAAGAQVGGDPACNAPILPTAGAAGQTIPNYTYAASTVLVSNYCSELLPVEILWFSATYSNKQVFLKWQVSQPAAADHYEIERSMDGNNWTTIATQPAVENILIYHNADLQPQHGYNQYRLKIVEKTNAVFYSRVQRVYVPGKNEMISIYPNPATNRIFVSGVSATVELRLFDFSGKLIWQKQIPPALNHTGIELPSLSTGVYVVKIGESVHRLVIH